MVYCSRLNIVFLFLMISHSTNLLGQEVIRLDSLLYLQGIYLIGKTENATDTSVFKDHFRKSNDAIAALELDGYKEKSWKKTLEELHKTKSQYGGDLKKEVPISEVDSFFRKDKEFSQKIHNYINLKNYPNNVENNESLKEKENDRTKKLSQNKSKNKSKIIGYILLALLLVLVLALFTLLKNMRNKLKYWRIEFEKLKIELNNTRKKLSKLEREYEDLKRIISNNQIKSNRNEQFDDKNTAVAESISGPNVVELNPTDERRYVQYYNFPDSNHSCFYNKNMTNEPGHATCFVITLEREEYFYKIFEHNRNRIIDINNRHLFRNFINYQGSGNIIVSSNQGTLEMRNRDLYPTEKIQINLSN